MKLTARLPESNHAALGSLAFALVVLARLLFASGDGFSYDYANYQTYFHNIQEADWDMSSGGWLTFPYALVPGGGKFEIGFVLLVKALLSWVNPTVAYAMIAASSVGLRCFVMRKFGLSWTWVLLIQVYAITVFEANALRAGIALSVTLCGLLFFLRNRWLYGLLAFAVGISLHFQAIIFSLPFIGFTLLPQRWLMRWWVALGIVAATALATLMTIEVANSIGLSKLEDYVGMKSGAVGVNLVSVLSLGFVLSAFVFAFHHAERFPAATERDGNNLNLVWLRTLFASVPALVLLIFGTDLSAVGDRAWQFALIVLVAASPGMLRTVSATRVRNVAIGLLILVLLINTLLRYPLSNFFAPVLPQENIMPESSVAQFFGAQQK